MIVLLKEAVGAPSEALTLINHACAYMGSVCAGVWNNYMYNYYTGYTPPSRFSLV